MLAINTRSLALVGLGAALILTCSTPGANVRDPSAGAVEDSGMGAVSTSGAGGAAGNSGSGGADASASAGTSAASLSFLSVSGEDIVDAQNRKVFLRGVGLGNWLLPEGYMWKFTSPRGDRPRRIEARIEELIGAPDAESFWKEWRARYITEADVARIAALGFNSLRVAINARVLLPEGQDSYDESGFAHLAALVRWSKAHNIYVIFDMHGAPGGQTGANIDDSATDYPDLFNSIADQDRLVKLWTELARRYANEPTVLGYDLLNEPLPYNDSAKKLWLLNPKLYPLYQRITASIRSVDPRHIVIVEGAHWASDWTALGEPFDANQVYSFHLYTQEQPSIAMIQKYFDARAKWKRPVWVGETGENSNAWYRSFISLLERNNMGWCFWPWKKMDTTNSPYSFARPQGWDAVVQYVDAAGSKPTREEAKQTLGALLDNIRFENSTYFQPVVCSMLTCP